MSRQTMRAAARPPVRQHAGARRDWLRWGSLALAVAGALDAAYLTWVKLAGLPAFCGESHACDTVQTSIYSEMGGVPIAVLGLGAFLVLAALLGLEPRTPALAAWGPVAV